MYEFEAGDGLVVRVSASVTTATRVDVTVKYDDGTSEFWHIDATSAGTRAAELFRPGSGDVFPKDGRVTSLAVDALGATKRGQYYIHLFVERRDVGRLMSLAAFYVTSMFFGGLGFFEQPIHDSGGGHLAWRTVANDIAPVSITEVLAASGAFRRVYGFAWYYHASGDIADRILRVNCRAPGLSIPTGFSVSETVYNPHIAALTLSQDQEGILYSYKNRGGDGYSSRNDNAALTVDVSTTAAQIWPVDIVENDLMELRFDVVDAEAADRHSIFILQEEWLEE